MDAISLSTLSVNTVSTNQQQPHPETTRCQSIILCLFGDEFSPKRCLCYIYGLFCVCLIFGAIILLTIHPIKRQKYKIYVPAIPEHTDNFQAK